MAEHLPPVVQKLDADIAEYIAKLDAAEARLKRFADEGPKSVEQQMVPGMRQAGRDAGEAAGKDALAGFEAEVDRSAKSVGERVGKDFGDGLGKAKDGLKDMERAGKDVGTSLEKDLGEKPAKDIEGFFSKMTNSVTKHFQDLGVQSGDAFEGGFTEFLGSVAGAVWPVLVPAAAVAASEVGAMFATALTGAVGAGGLVLGIKGAMRDPGVQAATKQFGSDVSAAFTDATRGFVQPVEDAVARLDRFLVSGSDSLASALQPLTKALGPIETGIEGFVNRMMPGLTAAFRNAQPVLAEFALELPGLGKSLGDFFNKISSNTGANTSALHQLFFITESAINAVGTLVQGLQKMWNGFVDFADKATGVEAKVWGWLPVVGPQIKATHKDLDGMKASLTEAGDAANADSPKVDALTRSVTQQRQQIDALTSAWDKWTGTAMNADQANLTVHQNLLDLTDALKQNGATFDLNTRAGENNYGMLLQNLQGLKDQRQANIAAGMSQDQANAVYQRAADKILDMARANGLDAAKAQDLRNQVDGLKSSLDSLSGKTYSYTIWAKQVTTGSVPMLAHGLAKGGVVRAAQGLVSGVMAPRNPGTLILAGEPETGGEVLAPLRGISKQRAMDLARVIGDAYGFSVASNPAALGALTAAGGSSAMVGGSVGAGTPSRQVIENHISLYMDGRQIHQQLIQTAQRYKSRTGTTGLT